MRENVTNIANFLKDIIYEKGETYLEDEPYEVYKEIVKANICKKETAASILHLFVCFESKDFNNIEDKEIMSKLIQKKCNFKKGIADVLTEILISLYSIDNKNNWKKNEFIGLKEFFNEEFNFSWHGYSVWDNGNVTLDCNYDAKIVLKPTNKIKNDENLAQELKKNAFLTKELIYDYFSVKIKKCLDDDFEYYCTCEEYYEPIVEDYYDNLEYTLRDWCKENGFEFVSCEGKGVTGDYEPKYSGHWY